MSDKKENRHCPMCEAENAMVHNPKTERIVQAPFSKEEKLTVIGDGWQCSICNRSGSFPDDIVTKILNIDKMNEVNND